MANRGPAEAFSHWKAIVEAELKGAPFEKKLVTRTFEGLALQPLYTRADLETLSQVGSAPGQAPFLRGTRPQGYREASWEVAQEIAAESVQQFNAAVLRDLAAGQNSVVLDATTGGTAVKSQADLATALEGVDLTAVPVHIRAGADALAIAGCYVSLAEDRRVAKKDLTGSLTADPLGVWATTGTLPSDLDALYDSLAGWTSWAGRHAPHLRTIGVNGRSWADAGATAVQELAIALAAAAEYIGALGHRRVSAGTAIKQMRFEFAVGPQFFTEIAKLRAWRLLWSRMVVAFGEDAAAATEAQVHAATSRWNKTLLDPHVNMLRVTTEALSAVLGGCDSLHIAPYDEITGKTDDFSRRIARNVHTILAEEFGFTQTADPAGGSWYVETLTDQLARKAWEQFQAIQKQGGYRAALEAGFLQHLVAEAAAEKTDAVGKRRLPLVGTNLFPNLKEKPLTPMPRPAEAAAVAAPSAAPVTTVSPNAAWSKRFDAVLAAARQGASIGELAALTPRSPAPAKAVAAVNPLRASAGFETLRAASEAFLARTGRRPRVFLAKIGPAAQHKARADFSAGFFATGGFEVLAKQAFETAQAAAEAAAASGAPIAVLCSTDDTYPTLVPEFANAAKAARADLKVVLAGLPADTATVASYRATGIDEFIHIRANVHAILTGFLKQIGAIA